MAVWEEYHRPFQRLDRHRLMPLLREYGKERLIQALYITAVERNKPGDYKYLRDILARWQDDLEPAPAMRISCSR